MVVEQRPEVAERLLANVVRRDLGAQRPGEAVELHVLAQDPLDERRVGAVVTQVDGEQLLLLTAEVLDRVREEGLDVCRGGAEPLVGAAVRGPQEPARLDELVVMVFRQRDERRVPLHDSSR